MVVAASAVAVGCGASELASLSEAEVDSVQLSLDGTVGDRAGPHGGRGRHVPEAAITACASQAAGAECTFIHRERTLTGTCRARPDDATALVCRPNPPEELVTACVGRSEGEACSATTPRGQTIDGRCHAPRFEDAPLLCAPERGPCHHGMGDGGTHEGPPPGRTGPR
jgi:hypothetical protein